MSPLSPEPCQNRADHDGRSIGDRELVVSRRQPSPLLDVGKRTLHHVAVPISSGIECRGPSTFATALLPSRDLILLLRDHRPNATQTQIVAVASGPISTISQNRVWACASTTTTSPRDSNIGQHLRQNHSVMALPASDHHSQGRPRPSTAWWIFVVSPPRERPMPCPAGSHS